MSDVSFLPDAAATGGVSSFAQVIPKTRSSYELLDRAETLHRQARDLNADSADIRRQSLLRDLEERQRTVARQSGSDLLAIVADAGFAWRDVARLVQVSVPAVQKWRRGEGMTGPNRSRIARLVAFLDVLSEHFVMDPVSWLEMPVKDNVALSRMDLLIDERDDLVLELISDDANPLAIDQILDEYDPTWRDSRVDDRFEAFVAADGIVSIRPKR